MIRFGKEAPVKNIGKLILAIAVILPLMVGGLSARAASEEDIEASIQSGLQWLAAEQQPDGSWSGPTATTCFAVLKFEDRGWELSPPPGEGPFDPGYVYGPQVEAGLDYLFSQVQESGGLVFVPGHWVYETGICMMALAASREPGRIVPPVGGPVDGWTYEQVLRGMLDWMEDAQSDGGCEIGGWGYSPNDERVDNSVTGYATLAIGYAISPVYGFGLTVDPIVLAKLDTFVSNIQHPVSGGSGYELWEGQDPCESDPGNTLRTGNLLYEMALVGRPLADPTVQAAIGFIENNWPGWMGSAQAAFTMMKGLEAYQIETLGAGIGDWFDEVSGDIVSTQNPDGSWPPTMWGDSLLATEWNLLTLERVVALVVIEVDIDIKPGSYPNSINLKSRGVIPVAILSTPFFDATSEVDTASLTFGATGDEESLAFCNPSAEDVNGDGLLDQVCHFRTQDTGFECGDTQGILRGQTVDGVPLQGSDSVRIVPCR